MVFASRNRDAAHRVELCGGPPQRDGAQDGHPRGGPAVGPRFVHEGRWRLVPGRAGEEGRGRRIDQNQVVKEDAVNAARDGCSRGAAHAHRDWLWSEEVIGGGEWCC